MEALTFLSIVLAMVAGFSLVAIALFHFIMRSRSVTTKAVMAAVFIAVAIPVSEYINPGYPGLDSPHFLFWVGLGLFIFAFPFAYTFARLFDRFGSTS